MSAISSWLPEHQHHVLYSVAHADATIDTMASVLEEYLQEPGPLDLQSRLTATTEEVVLAGVAPLPQAVSRLFSDALNQLRNVLEHALAAEVAAMLRRALTEDEARAVEVPATRSEEAFDNWTRHRHRKSHGLFQRGTELGERLARLQPWTRRDADLHPLRRLVAHTNASKHQAPAVMTVRAGKVLLDSAPREAGIAPHILGDVGSVIASVPRGTREGLSVWPQVAVRRPHTGELRTVMWEVREIEEWVRRIALPILVTGLSDMPELRPQLDIKRGYGSLSEAWLAAGASSAAARSSERIAATSLRSDIVDMMVAEDGERSRAAYATWLANIGDAEVVSMFDPLGDAARARDYKTIVAITERWRALALTSQPTLREAHRNSHADNWALQLRSDPTV